MPGIDYMHTFTINRVLVVDNRVGLDLVDGIAAKTIFWDEVVAIGFTYEEQRRRFQLAIAYTDGTNNESNPIYITSGSVAKVADEYARSRW